MGPPDHECPPPHGPPDHDGRVRLLRLYGSELGVGELTDDDLAATVDATEGRTATYIREVVRRAAVKIAERESEGALRVDAATLAAAAAELLDDRAALTRALLGGVEQPDAEPALVSPGGLAYSPIGGMGWANIFVRRGRDLISGGPVTPCGPDDESTGSTEPTVDG